MKCTCGDPVGTNPDTCETCAAMTPEAPPPSSVPMADYEPKEQAVIAPSAPEKPLAVGLHRGVPMVDYINDPAPAPSLNASTIRKLLDKSPAHARLSHPRLGSKPRDESRAADIGSAAHAVTLEGPAAVEVITEYKNFQTNAAKAIRDDCYAKARIPIFERDADAVYQMAKIAGAAIRERVGDGEAETTGIWQEKNGIYGRIRTDYKAERHVVDMKTSKSAEPGFWIRKVLFGAQYDVSAAWQLRGLEQLGEKKEGGFLFFVQETSPPFEYSWVPLDGEALSHAEKMCRKAVKVWGECLKSGKWPGYPKHDHYAELPAWRAIQFEESELAEELGREIFGGKEMP